MDDDDKAEIRRELERERVIERAIERLDRMVRQIALVTQTFDTFGDFERSANLCTASQFGRMLTYDDLYPRSALHRAGFNISPFVAFGALQEDICAGMQEEISDGPVGPVGPEESPEESAPACLCCGEPVERTARVIQPCGHIVHACCIRPRLASWPCQDCVGRDVSIVDYETDAVIDHVFMLSLD